MTAPFLLSDAVVTVSHIPQRICVIVDQMRIGCRGLCGFGVELDGMGCLHYVILPYLDTYLHVALDILVVISSVFASVAAYISFIRMLIYPTLSRAWHRPTLRCGVT